MPPEQTVPVISVPNTSGQGSAGVVPPEISRWNWGAFGFNWIWGIGNSTWIALLMFVPFANIVMPFVLGAKGNEWAWQNKHWDSVEQFKKVQRMWTIVWLWVFGVTIVFAVLVFGIVGLVSYKFFISDGGAKSFGTDVAKNFAQATFNSQDVSAYVADGYAPDSVLIEYDQTNRGAYQSVTFNNFSTVDGNSGLSGQVQFANDSESICVVLHQNNAGVWKVTKASQACGSDFPSTGSRPSTPGVGNY
jgi:hypothetical protein